MTSSPMSERPTLDELKLARDGHLWALKPLALIRAERLARVGPPLWLVERDGEGVAVRMWWKAGGRCMEGGPVPHANRGSPMSERGVSELVWWPSYRGTFHVVQRERGRVQGEALCGALLYRPTYPLAGHRKCGRCVRYADALARRCSQPEATDVRL